MSEVRKQRIVPVKAVYGPENYKDLAPGSILVSLGVGKLWRVVSSSEECLQIIPYSGGCCYTLFSKISQAEFGLLEDPKNLPERIYL